VKLIESNNFFYIAPSGRHSSLCLNLVESQAHVKAEKFFSPQQLAFCYGSQQAVSFHFVKSGPSMSLKGNLHPGQ
jgi:hypothetical protein